MDLERNYKNEIINIIKKLITPQAKLSSSIIFKYYKIL